MGLFHRADRVWEAFFPEAIFLTPHKSVRFFFLVMPRRLSGNDNTAIDLVNVQKYAITQISSAVLVSQMALLIQQTRAALVYHQPI